MLRVGSNNSRTQLFAADDAMRNWCCGLPLLHIMRACGRAVGRAVQITMEPHPAAQQTLAVEDGGTDPEWKASMHNATMKLNIDTKTTFMKVCMRSQHCCYFSVEALQHISRSHFPLQHVRRWKCGMITPSVGMILLVL